MRQRIVSCFHLLILLTISLVNCSSILDKTGCGKNPEIRLIVPTQNISVDEKQIVVTERVNLTLECRSRKPIDLDFEGQLALQLIQVETYRSNSAQEECFSIQIQFTSDRESTGQFRCWHIGLKETEYDTLYVYANGGSLPNLLHGDFGDEMVISVKKIAEQAILPCQVTNPKIPVALYKTTREGFELQTVGEHLYFDPTTGFTLNLKKLPDPFGKYKCVAKSEKMANDEAFFELVENDNAEKIIGRGTSPQIFENEFAHGKEYQYQAFICTGNLGLEMHSSSNCRSPIECRLLEKCMTEVTKCSHSCKCSSRGQNCSKSLLKQYFISPRKFLQEKCETVGKNENGGVIHCTTSKFLSGGTVPYFIGLDGHIVTNWRAAPTKEILATAATFGTHVVYNVGEKIPFACVASRYVFAKGFVWKLLLQNGTMISANVTVQNVRTTNSLIKEEVLIHISLPEIKNVVCEAPLWNETSWLNSSLTLNVRDTVAPLFLEPSNVTVFFHSGELNRTLVCGAKGFPHPDIVWYKNGEEIRSDLIFDSTKDNITVATFTFPEIMGSEHSAIYMCNASNPRGMVFKTFTIRVRASLWTIIFSVLGTSLFLCLVVVVIMSVRLYKGGRKPNGYTFHFSDFDVDEFKKGNVDQIKRCTDVSEKAFYLPYDEDLYEIKDGNIQIDCENILGQGEFGVVIKGKMLPNNEEPYPVAVKTLKGHDIHHLKALLSELKIMIYLGSHKHVVKLVGAVTTQLCDRRAFVVVEYCALGNLEIYIRQRRSSYLDEFGVENLGESPPVVAPSYVRFSYSFKTTDLIKWSCEIATGMEFLGSKKIVHGDVALRNILLDANQSIKITDFGLSKQLYKRSSYYLSKSKDVPLPWKWLSPEALTDHTFSFQSDIWSFGILLWEMFSLAENPYNGVTYGAEFLQQIVNGFRLNKPQYCNTEIYSIMRECWRELPNERPSFAELRQEFAQRLPIGLLDSSDSEDEIAIQNAANHLQEILLPPYIEECQPLRA